MKTVFFGYWQVKMPSLAKFILGFGCFLLLIQTGESGCYVCDSETVCNGQEPMELCPNQQGGACMIEAYRTEAGGYHVVKRCLSACPVFVNTTAEHIRCCTNVEDCTDIEDIHNPTGIAGPRFRPPSPDFRDSALGDKGEINQVPNGLRPRSQENELRPKSDDQVIKYDPEEEKGKSGQVEVTQDSVTEGQSNDQMSTESVKPDRKANNDMGKTKYGKPRRAGQMPKSRSHVFSSSTSNYGLNGGLVLGVLLTFCFLH